MEVDGWSGRHPLLVNPPVSYWAAFLGGSASEYPHRGRLFDDRDVVVSAEIISGDITVGGATNSLNYPTTFGAYQGINKSLCADCADAFITRLSASGTIES